MRINIILLVIACIALPAIASAQNSSFTLSGKIGNLDTPATAYLDYTVGGNRRIYVTPIKRGNFTFKGTVSGAQSAYLTINKNGTGVDAATASRVPLYIEPGVITVLSPDSLANAKVTAGSVNADYCRLRTALAPVTVRRALLEKELEATSQEERNSVSFKERVHKIEDTLQARQKAIQIVFIQANPGSFVSLFTLLSLKDSTGNSLDVTETEPLFMSLSPEVRATTAGVAYAKYIVGIKNTSIGASAPDFAMKDTHSRMVSLRDFKGKYVLIDFWASWCVPCRRENPELLKVFQLYKHRKFTILGVSIDGKKEDWLKAVHEDRLVWVNVSDLKVPNTVAELYVVHSIPQNFLVGPDGKIVAANLHDVDLEHKLEALLSNKLRHKSK